MKKILLLFFILAVSVICSNAQDFVKYSGDTEKNLITSAKTADDFVKLALASELSDRESGVIYDTFIEQIKALNLQALVGDKSGRHLKKIYDVVHDHFLKKYNPGALFGDFIVNGEYNHITATILYAYVLESLGVPYQITQYPAHVFITAGAENVKFETIDAAGVYVINDASKQKLVLNAIKNGYIDQSYAIRIGVEKAFDEFMYDKEDIDLKETVGILYFGRAMNELDADVAAAAYSDLCKSDILFPDKKNAYFKYIILLSMADNFKYNDMADWRAVTNIINAPNTTEDVKRNIVYQFENFLNDKLINGGQKDKVAEVYNYLHGNIRDTAIKKQIAKDYFSESAHYYVITNDYGQALECLEAVYPLDPNNPVVIANFAQMILHKFGNLQPTEQNLASLNTYMDQYPAMKNNVVIATLYEYYYGILGQMGYITGNGATGEKYLKMLTDELDIHPDNADGNHVAIAGLFAKASIYYFRKQQRQKAIEVLKTGLKYEPNSDELQRKLAVDSGH